MEMKWKVLILLLNIVINDVCNGYPIHLENGGKDSHTQLLTGLIAVLLTICCIVVLAGCLCCKRNNGFKEFRDSPVVLSVANNLDHGHVNPIANGEFTIFTPLSPPHYNNNVFLSNQEITRNAEDYRYGDIDIHSWFDGSEKEFPRTKLKYIKELGKGWFGRVVEGAAQDLYEVQNWTPVVVRILDANSSTKDRILFLNDANIYRLGSHPNVLTLLGRSLDTVPMLLIQEYCVKGDVKKHLRESLDNREKFLTSELPLRWCHQISLATKHIHNQNIAHPDLAARNCLIDDNLNIKVGDYGLATSNYPEDYYQGAAGLPIRWCSPESVNYTSTTIQPNKMSLESNIWSFGVTMWEIFECGKQPYSNLNDDEVISQVLGPPCVRLQIPGNNILYMDYMYRLMQTCWTTLELRPKIVQLELMLDDLLKIYKNMNLDNRDKIVGTFDERWNNLKPNTIVKTDNHITDGENVSTSRFMQDKNLNGSLNNLLESSQNNDDMESWLENLATNTNDMSYVRGVHDAMNDLDNVIALENVSSSESSHRPSPAPPPKPKLQFKLGPTRSSTQKVDRHNEDNLLVKTSSGSETEDENWKKKVEKGVYSEKVRQKSRSVTDLMVLTHIDCSESESETPMQSLDYRVNYKNVRLMQNLENASLMYGSEGNLLSVKETFQEELKKLKEDRKDSLLFVPVNINEGCSPMKTVSSSSSHTSQADKDSSKLETMDINVMQDLGNSKDLMKPYPVYNIYNVTVESKFQPEFSSSNKLDNIINFHDLIRESKPDNAEKLPDIISDIQDNLSNIKYKLMDETIVSNGTDASVQMNLNKDINLDSTLNAIPGSLSNNCPSTLDINHIDLKLEGIERLESSPNNNIKCDESTSDLENFYTEVTESHSASREFPGADLDSRKMGNNLFAENATDETTDELYDKIDVKETATEMSEEIIASKESDNCSGEYENGSVGTEDSNYISAKDQLEESDETKLKMESDSMSYISAENTSNVSSVGTIPIKETDLPDENMLNGFFNKIHTDTVSVDNAINSEASCRTNFENESGSVIDDRELSETVVQGTTLQNISQELIREESRVCENAVHVEQTHIIQEEATNLEKSPLSTPIPPTDVYPVFSFTEPTKSAPDGVPEQPECTSNDVSTLNNAFDEVNNSHNQLNSMDNEKQECADDSIIFGSCSDYTIDLYAGLKTSSTEAEEMKFSSNFNTNDYDQNCFNYSLDSWDNFLDKTMDKQYDDYNSDSNAVTFLRNDNEESNDNHEEDLDNEENLNESSANKTFTINDKEGDTFLMDANNDSDEWEPGEGWFLHEQSEEPTGDMNVQESTDSYVGFSMDDDVMSAIRNELLMKLPHAQRVSSEKMLEEEDTDTGEKVEVFIKFNTPLSPIPEESSESNSCQYTPQREESENEMDDNSDWTEPALQANIDDDIVDNTATHSPHLVDSPTKEQHNRHTPSQDSCCSNDTLFNLEELIANEQIVNGKESDCEENKISGETVKETDTDKATSLEVEGEKCAIETNSKSGGDNIDQTHFNQTHINVEETATLFTSTNSEDQINNEDINETQQINQNDVIIKHVEDFLTHEKCDFRGNLVKPEELKVQLRKHNNVPLPSPEDRQWKELHAPFLTYNIQNSQSVSGDEKPEDDGLNDYVNKPSYVNAPNDDKNDGHDYVNTNKDHYSNVDTPIYTETATDAETDIYVQPPAYANAPLYAEPPNEKPNYANVPDYVNDTLMDDVRCTYEKETIDPVYVGNPIENDENLEDIYGPLTDIRFSGPCDNQMMSTSFSESNDLGDEQDWDSGSETRSSSSGEFLWKHDEHEESVKALSAAPQELIINEMTGMDENEGETSESTGSEEDGDGPEFVPSAWDKYAIPSKSALRSPEKTLEKPPDKKSKGVWFKKQKYHCVYEYPKEPESPILQSCDLWKPTTNYATLTDCNLGIDCYKALWNGQEYDMLDNNGGTTNDTADSSYSTSLGGDFFISGSTKPFDNVNNLGSEFFPGRCTADTWADFIKFNDNITPDSGIDDLTPGSLSDANEMTAAPSSVISANTVQPLKQLAAHAVDKANNQKLLGGLRHTRNKLKLDLPPSPTAFSASKVFTVEPEEDLISDIRSVPTFTTFGKSRFLVQQVDTPTDEKSENYKNVSFEALPHRPLLKTEIIKDLNADKERQSVEIVRGEASLLDSADEDSGIESCTLERKKMQNIVE